MLKYILLMAPFYSMSLYALFQSWDYPFPKHSKFITCALAVVFLAAMTFSAIEAYKSEHANEIYHKNMSPDGVEELPSENE